MPQNRHRQRSPCPLHLLSLLLVMSFAPSTAFADATVFLGSTMSPTNRAAKGLAIGVGLIVIGFEFEFSDTGESEEDLAPSLRTGMGNVLLQTPVPIGDVQLYFTTGTGLYRERLGTVQETHVGFNTGGGAKVSLVGPIRARLDYRIFNLRGEPQHSTVHRIYAGLNLAF